MRYLKIVTALTSLCELTLVFGQSDEVTQNCKCVPNDPCWPSDADIQTLNETVGGRLIQGVPPGSVCYPDQPDFNETKCEYVRDNWTNSTFHALDPISVGWAQWAGNPCPPIFPNGTSVDGDDTAGQKGCKLGSYPAYALNASEAAHVQSVVRFVAQHKIRLNVKSTGHSFQGRSTAFGSISIWTHYLQGIQYHPDFQADSCSNNGQMAFRIAAGSRVVDVYEAANDQNAIVVGGSAEDVGIVGWMTGGGHGPLSQSYGMGVDNLLQATMVTPQGELVTANECQHSDLFWALRGGGGGTFGVVTEVVTKAYPAPTVQSMSFLLSAKSQDNLTTFWDGVTHFWSELPRLKEGGVSGYSYVLPLKTSPYGSWSMAGRYVMYNQPNGTIESLFEPFKQQYAPFSDSLTWGTTPGFYSTYFESWKGNVENEIVGGSGAILGSRLLPARSLTNDLDHLRSTIQNVTNGAGSLGTPLQFFMVANSANRNLNVSLNPAWRDATLHVIATGGFLDNATLPEQVAAYNRMTYDIVPQLKSLAPDSGSYFNECDPFEPAWQWDFFGENYPRLRAIKERYDPDSVLWCKSCVGSEDWVLNDNYGTEDSAGRLCQASWALKSQAS